MTSFEEIINWIFGGSVDASKIISIIVAIYAVIKSITEWSAKRKLIKADQEQTALLKQLTLAREENKNLKTCVSKLGDVILTAYLSSNTVPPEVKKELGKIGSELNKAADIPLSETTNKLIEVATVIVPNQTLNEHKDELHEATQLAEEVIDNASDLVNEAIDKIKI